MRTERPRHRASCLPGWCRPSWHLRPRRGLWLLVPALLLVAAVPAAATEPPDPAALAARMRELEAEVSRLVARVGALERRLAAPVAGPAGFGGAAGAPAAPVLDDAGVPLPDDGLVWTFDPFVDGNPLAVTYKGLDRAAGRVDLLVRVTAPLPNPAAWSTVGAVVPLHLNSRQADGGGTAVGFVLARGGRTDPGAHLHLTATLDPARAAAARQLLIGPAAGGN